MDELKSLPENVYDLLSVYYDEVRDIDEKSIVEVTNVVKGERVLRLLDYFKIDTAQGRPIMDLGCGTGNLCCYLGFLGFRVIGVDNSEGMLRVAEQKKQKFGLSNIRFIHKDASRLTMEDVIDEPAFVYSRELCDNISDKEALLEIFKGLFSLLPHSAVVIFENCTELGIGLLITPVERVFADFTFSQHGSYDPATKKGLVEYSFTPTGNKLPPLKTTLPIHYWDKDELQELLVSAGFGNVESFDAEVNVSYVSGTPTVSLGSVSFLSDMFLVKGQKP